MINKIDELLNCDMEPIFRISELTNMSIGDNSKHFRMTKGRNWVDFSILGGKLAVYMWECPSEGKVFLKALEKYAKKNKLKLIIPTVLNMHLEKILEDNGYTMKEVTYRDDVCELWTKDT